MPSKVAGVANTCHVEADFVGKFYRRRIALRGCSNVFHWQSQLYGLALLSMKNKWPILRNAVARFSRTQLIASGRHSCETVPSARIGLKREFMRVVIALERNRRIFNRAMLGITDRSCNDCRFLTVFVLAVGCHHAQRCERNVYAEHSNNSGGDGDHQEVCPTATVNANLPAHAIISNLF